ncbi:hypothetical protein CEUSTIGMA_g3768.t1 [Chlamydomonas eustigma]|uniref:RNA helicase n=1 Tax=Chlamydomonas eustigma TaxID=1157962 RepID=A0A250X0A7_9CHLO|nr:hypothetical protein CEUSTIGMA_g3768.t1 [Chlamydomonas eustigma]|eukprot:GAX76322.1 hypothetical protein CEUSTIGMA_g3768.t1 [Chlamydomonas eustigma]
MNSSCPSSCLSFRDLMVPEPLLQSLTAAGYQSPSPVQQASIPLGRMGADLIVQAKSGTGKTITFAIICLERLKLDTKSPQALILAPTREIAIQSEQVIQKIAGGLPEAMRPGSAVFVGGLNMLSDEKRLRRLVHIVVGTPGRVCALLQAGSLPARSLSMLVLDEADTLLSDAFYSDVTWVYDQLPKKKQVLAFSATYTPELLADLEPLMKRPQHVMLCSESTSLEGVRQFYVLVGQTNSSPVHQCLSASEGHSEIINKDVDEVFSEKVAALLQLLGSLSFHQAAVFLNRKPQAEWLAGKLTSEGFPAAYLSGDRPQVERMEAMEAVRGFKLRVIVSTDVMARGVDLDRVNVVANLDLPRDSATYVHRVGRTGRFGSLGICVNYVTDPELQGLKGYLEEAQAGIAEPLPAVIPPDLYSFEEVQTECEKEALQKLKEITRVQGSEEVPPPPSLKPKQQQQAAASEHASRDYDSKSLKGKNDSSGWFYVPSYGWQYDPVYSQEWAAYYAQLYGYSNQDSLIPHAHDDSGPMNMNDAPHNVRLKYEQAYYDYLRSQQSTGDALAVPPVDRMRYQETGSGSALGAAVVQHGDNFGAVHHVAAAVNDGNTVEAVQQSGECEEHLSLDVLDGHESAEQSSRGRGHVWQGAVVSCANADEGFDFRSRAAVGEDEDEAGDFDLPDSEDLEDHAVDLISKLEVQPHAYSSPNSSLGHISVNATAEEWTGFSNLPVGSCTEVGDPGAGASTVW